MSDIMAQLKFSNSSLPMEVVKSMLCTRLTLLRIAMIFSVWKASPGLSEFFSEWNPLR